MAVPSARWATPTDHRDGVKPVVVVDSAAEEPDDVRPREDQPAAPRHGSIELDGHPFSTLPLFPGGDVFFDDRDLTHPACRGRRPSSPLNRQEVRGLFATGGGECRQLADSGPVGVFAGSRRSDPPREALLGTKDTRHAGRRRAIMRGGCAGRLRPRVCGRLHAAEQEKEDGGNRGELHAEALPRKVFRQTAIAVTTHLSAAL